MARGTFENLRPDFALKVQEGDIILAGRNFGMGSSREEAVFVLKLLGIRAIFARSFARIYFRNAINLGLPAFEILIPPGSIEDGAYLEVDLETATLTNLDRGTTFALAALPPLMQGILAAGGALNWLQSRSH